MGVLKVKAMAEAFKAEWVMNNFIPKVNECYNVEQQGYNYRMTALMSLSSVMPVLSQE